MSNNLAAEVGLSNDPRLGQALLNRYGANQFSSDSLIDFVGEGKLLQRKGVDFITPGGLKIDLKLRRPNVTFDDLMIELISVDKSQTYGTYHGYIPSNAAEVIDYLDNLPATDRLGWTIDPTKVTDEIVYYLPGLNKISFINAPALREATPQLIEAVYPKRVTRSPFRIAFNRGYNTVNLPINYSVLRGILGSNIDTITV